MEPYKLEKPNLTSIDVAKILSLYDKFPEYVDAVYKACEPIYYFWDKVKYKKTTLPLTPLELWALVKHVRRVSSRKTYIRSEDGKYFKWLRLIYTDEQCNKIDVKFGGEIFTHYSQIITPYGRQKLLTKSIIEEAIASSQLEGAATTTPIAKRMLLENRAPRDRSERMIVNNYKTMQALTGDYKDKPLTRELLLEMHGLITKDTLREDRTGRFRRDSDKITINDGIRYIYHTPPRERFLNPEIDRLIKYANDQEGEGFVHPVIKAIFIHFWVGYLHPFYDGNGRMARTLFYWYLLKKGYWAIQYLPISLVFKNAHKEYGLAFVYTEQDEYDLTYFYDFHMRKLLLAMQNFDEYIHRKVEENVATADVLDRNPGFNERQKELLRYFLVKGDGHYITPTSYVSLYKVSKVTALKDLQVLEKLGILNKKRFGKNTRYYTTDKLNSKSF